MKIFRPPIVGKQIKFSITFEFEINKTEIEEYKTSIGELRAQRQLRNTC